jgi:anaerobic nitric oxide reductase transcription regulator
MHAMSSMPTVSSTGIHAADVRQLATRARLADEWVLAGRHAAAARLLREVAFALIRRGACSQAAAVWQTLGGLLLERGRAADACDAFGETIAAARTSGDAVAAWDASVWLATSWTDAGQLVRAEEVCETALRSAPDPGRAAWAAAVLANIRLWQRRFDELPAFESDTGPTLPAVPRAMTTAAAVACLLTSGQLFRAGLLARRFLTVPEGATAGGASETRAGHIVRAIASSAHLRLLCETGDLDLASARLADVVAHARAGRAPVRAYAARLVWTAALARAGQARAAARARRQLLRVSSALPPLLRSAVRNGERPPERPHHASPVVAAWPAAREVRLVAEEADDRTAAYGLLRSAVQALASRRLDLFVFTRGTSSGLVMPMPALTVGDGRPTSIAVQVRERGGRVGPVRHGAEESQWECGVPIANADTWTSVLAGSWEGHAPSDAQAHGLELVAALLAMRVDGVAAAVAHTDVTDHVMPEIVGTSRAIAGVREAVARAARAPFAVLIEGESGVGKELVARAIHRLSARSSRPFADVNCAALPDEIIDAELFGHARGAFTGAAAERPGLFEAANGGTLFLDEVADLSARAQAKLLRVLQQQEVRRLGETAARRIDVRVVSAANRELRSAARDGLFRHDLLYRLEVIRVGIPPLRDRPEDITILARRFWNAYVAEVGTKAVLTAEVFAALRQHRWPGNVRELQNVIAGLAVSAPGAGFLRARHVSDVLGTTPLAVRSLAAARAAFERTLITEAVLRAGGNHAVAARALGVSRQGLAKMWIRLELGAGASSARAHRVPDEQG